MRRILFVLLLPLLLFSYQIEIKKWEKGETFYGFLKKNSIPISVYYNLDKKTQKRVRFITRNTKVYLLKNGKSIKQALIPLNEKEQLQIMRDAKDPQKFQARVVPIYYDEDSKYFEITINNFLSYDVYNTTRENTLSAKLTEIFSDKINFRLLPKGTTLKLLYREKIRFGEVEDVTIKFAEFSNRFYTVNAFLNPSDNRYYNDQGESLKGMFLNAPLRYTRISSPYGMRFHPILKRRMMHHGIDYVNKSGTPIKTVADGKVIYKGWMGGYGRTVKVRHSNGYTTLYGHLKGYGKIKRGQYIAQGKVIGYLGTSGRSTGPHLHFGVMKNNKWINPKRIKKSVKKRLYGNERKSFFAFVKEIKEEKEAVKVAMK